MSIFYCDYKKLKICRLSESFVAISIVFLTVITLWVSLFIQNVAGSMDFTEYFSFCK